MTEKNDKQAKKIDGDDAKISAAYREAVANDLPSSRIDQAILAHAKRAADETRLRQKRKTYYRWGTSLALASFVAVAIGVVQQVAFWAPHEPANTQHFIKVERADRQQESPMAAKEPSNAPTKTNNQVVAPGIMETPAAPQPQVVVQEEPRAQEDKIDRSAEVDAFLDELEQPLDTPAGTAADRSRTVVPGKVDLPAMERIEVTGSRIKRRVYWDSPEEWVAEIETLVAREDLVGARQELAALVEEYPDYEIPESLAHLLPAAPE